jgi:formylglycine-generating enzyme required for sulfatase activity
MFLFGLWRKNNEEKVLISCGAAFMMSSTRSDPLAEEAEFPQHQVTLEGFYIYTHEVTVEMYQTYVDAGRCMGITPLEAGPTSHLEDPAFSDHTVVGVDWVMARDYCQWAGGRLPTEAEWELASQGPESLLYPWGADEPSCDHVNMGGCYVPPDTQEVGQYRIGNSPEGVWDLSGNVWEWVHDWYSEDYYTQPPEENPIGPLEPHDPEHPLRVIRGGGFNSVPDLMCSAERKGLNPYRIYDAVGFRCVAEGSLSLPPADVLCGTF